jgi:uncharacterized protein
LLFATGTDKQFFALLNDTAQNITATAGLFSELTGDLGHAAELTQQMGELERRGDQYVHDLTALLNRLFVTPLEREDVLALAEKLDDVTDDLEAAAARLHLYKVRGEYPILREFARVIGRQAEEIAGAVQRLQGRKLEGLREFIVRINDLENEGDILLRQALAELFDQEQDPVQIIKLKEIYEALETVTDRAEDVADAMETIVMKHM